MPQQLAAGSLDQAHLPPPIRLTAAASVTTPSPRTGGGAALTRGLHFATDHQETRIGDRGTVQPYTTTPGDAADRIPVGRSVAPAAAAVKTKSWPIRSEMHRED